MHNRPLHHLVAVAAIAAFGTAFAGSEAGDAGASSGSSASPAMGAGAEVGGAIVSPVYSKLDKNQDGAISETEAATDKALAKQWDSVDLNKDGKLDQAEFARFEASQPSSGGASPSGSFPSSESGKPSPAAPSGDSMSKP